jgi:antitoxin ParD1/3/4
MCAEKLSVSLPAAPAKFVEQHQSADACKSRSEVIEGALVLLRQRESQRAYSEAAREDDPESEIAANDSLADEA